MGLNAYGGPGPEWGLSMLSTGGLGGDLEESQRSPQGAGGQSMLNPNFWDFQKVALRPMDSAPNPGPQLGLS